MILLLERFHFAKEGMRMARRRLTDGQWELIADIFPGPARTGRPPTDRRLVVDAIVWILRTGSPWRDLPEEFGPWETIYGLFNAWNSDGTLEKILRSLQAAQIDIGAIDEELWCIDGTIVRAHRCAAGGGKKGIRKNRLIMH
jgi:transposase